MLRELSLPTQDGATSPGRLCHPHGAEMQGGLAFRTPGKSGACSASLPPVYRGPHPNVGALVPSPEVREGTGVSLPCPEPTRGGGRPFGGPIRAPEKWKQNGFMRA